MSRGLSADPATATVVAVDFGATSIRVARVDLAAKPPAVEVVHRVSHVPVTSADGSLRWDWSRLVAETERGLEMAVALGPVASIGVDTWGVDYGLIDADGRLLSVPHSYRSSRTAGFRAVVDAIGERRLYELSGLQLQPFNTIFQLAAHDPGELAQAEHLLLLPDLLVHHLTGVVATERTAAGTTGLLDVRTGDWSPDLVAACRVPRRLLAPIVEPGTAAGAWRGIPVHRVGGHDTASAVVSIGPAGQGSAFVSTGTWLLVGREQPVVDTSVDAQNDNFTNEQGVAGDIRFLKNVAGFWLLEECRRRWGESDPATLLADAAQVDGGYTVFDASDPRFLAPENMDVEIRSAASIDPSAPRATVVRAIVESMAATAAAVLARLGSCERVTLLGGGAGTGLFHSALERHSALPVRVGAIEAASLGNALVQGVALGHFSDVAEARAALTS